MLCISFVTIFYQDFNYLQVPGAEGNFVFIKDSVFKKPDFHILPFPTYFEAEDDDNSEPLVADLGEVDPFMVAD